MVGALVLAGERAVSRDVSIFIFITASHHKRHKTKTN